MNNIKEIKKIYFHYGCNLAGFAKDYGGTYEEREKIREVVYKHKLEWSNEFLENVKNKIINSNTEYKFIKYTAKYELASKNFEHLYILSKIYFDKMINNKFRYVGIYIGYYELLLFDIPFIDDKEDFKEDTLLDYLYNNDKKRFYDTIEKLKIIIQYDKKDFEKNIKYIEKLQKYLLIFD